MNLLNETCSCTAELMIRLSSEALASKVRLLEQFDFRPNRRFGVMQCGRFGLGKSFGFGKLFGKSFGVRRVVSLVRAYL